MKKYFIILNCLLWFKLEAQQTYFNKRYDFNHSNSEGAWSLLVDSDNIWVTFTTDSFSTSGGLKFGLMKINNFGSLLLNTSYGSQYNFFYIGGSGSFNKTSDGNFISAGSKEDSISTDAMLLKFDNYGDTLWTKIFGDTSFQNGLMAKQTSDHGFALCGQDATDGSYGGCQMMLIKTDSAGNLQWEQRYGDSISAELAYAFTITADGGFALAGERKHPYDINIYLVKTDSSGNIEWEKDIGGAFGDRLFNIISSSDGNIVVVGQQGNYSSHFWPYAAKFDLLGNMIWEKHYGISASQTWFYSIRELPDGSFICVGDASDNGTSASAGLMVKIASNGDSLWYKKFQSSSPPFPSTNNRLRDVYLTPDGGFVACGIVEPAPPDTGNQDVWILKVDSNGCEIANCTVGVNDVLKNNVAVRVYPNPFLSELKIELNNYFDTWELQLYNMMGEEIKYEKVSADKNYTLKTNDLPGVLYLLNIIKNNELIYSGKISHITQ